MKRLISLLGSLSLVATSSVAVVACGTDKGDTEESTTELTSLIEDLLKDLELTTDDYWEYKNDSFFDVTKNSTSSYKFLTEANIKEYVPNVGEAVKGDENLETSQKEDLKSDLDKILASDQMLSYFKTNIDQEKYAILIEGIDFYKGFEPDWTSLEINYTNGSSAEDSNFISYVSMNLNLNFEYLDANNELADFSLAKRFIFTLTDDGILVEAIKNLETNITNDYYLSGAEYSWIDASNFEYENNEQLANIFKPNKTEFANIYGIDNTDFTTNITEFMKENYFSEIANIPLKFTGTVIFDSFTSNDVMNANKDEHVFGDTEFGQKLYSSIFSDLNHDVKKPLFGSETDVNDGQWNYLKDDYMKFYNSYNTRNKAKLAEIEKASGKSLNEDKELAFDNSIGNGLIKLKGLSIDINNSSYVHPINDFSIFVSMAVKNDETMEARETVEESYLFGAMYKNLEMGVQTFQDVFDIQPKEETSINTLPLARFSGDGISVSGEADNIWNEMKVDSIWGSVVTKSLSLTHPNLTKHRDVLLEVGRQNTYGWSLATSKNLNTAFSINENGINIRGTQYGGNDLYAWRFENNFINAVFNIEGVWRNVGKTVFERTPVSK